MAKYRLKRRNYSNIIGTLIGEPLKGAADVTKDVFSGTTGTIGSTIVGGMVGGVPGAIAGMVAGKPIIRGIANGVGKIGEKLSGS